MIEALAVIGWTLAAWLAWKLRRIEADREVWKKWTITQNKIIKSMGEEMRELRCYTPARGANGRFTKRGT